VNSLLGAPPGYIGHGEWLPINAMAQAPWSVLVCQNVNSCHPEVLNVLQGALEEGVIRQRDAGRVYLSDAVVVLTAPSELAGMHPVGFGKPREDASPEQVRASVEDVLGEAFVRQADVLCVEVPRTDAEQRRWLERHVLEALKEHYLHQGLEVSWDESFLTWAANRKGTRTGLTRLIEERLGRALIPRIPAPGAPVATVVVSVEGDDVTALPDRRTEAPDLPPAP
jgi:ATP-dependent Clp protease ATP-binding subunit ClpA